MGAHSSSAVGYKILYTNWRFHFIWCLHEHYVFGSKCQEWPWSSTPHMSIGTGLPGDGLEWVKRTAGTARTGQDIAKGQFTVGVGTYGCQ